VVFDQKGDAPYFSYLKNSHAFVDIFHLLGHAPGAFRTPNTQEEVNLGSKREGAAGLVAI
jgi:hypothetical protein